MKLDLNCDLGEGEPIQRPRALMRWITSANIACGGHAGDLASMRTCVRLAKTFGVHVGAHPSPWSRTDMGRSEIQISPDDLELLLLHQVGALEKAAKELGAAMHHIKLHGALYHAVESNQQLARRYARTVAAFWPKAIVYGFTQGHVLSEVRRAGLRAWAEGFADRGYQPDGQLVPRTQPGALLSSVTESVRRVEDLLAGRGLAATDGRRLPLHIDTICVHADTSSALQLVRGIGKLIETFAADALDRRSRRSPKFVSPNDSTKCCNFGGPSLRRAQSSRAGRPQ